MSLANHTVSAPANGTSQQINAHELALAFERCADSISVLSLDCFDTLLWRAVAQPKDVFFNLQHQELFQKLDFTARIREEGEKLAAQINRVKISTLQVSLADIYQAIYPHLNPDSIQQLVEAELAEEMRVCYAFQPVVNLMHMAKNQHKKIIIVSDTYLNQSQLKKLLAAHLPPDVLNMIDHIFCSSEFGKGKADFLFTDVLNTLKIPANSIMHIGDNVIADFHSPKNQGIQAYHFLQHFPKINDILRVQSVCAGFVDARMRTTHSLNNPFTALFSEKVNQEDTGSLIGYVTIGPILYAFAKFLLAEISLLKQTIKNLKVIFLMRDAYLPAVVCEALAEGKIGIQGHISRFAAIASSFRCQHDIDHYLAQNVSSLRFNDMCAQLLLTEELGSSLSDKARQAKQPVAEFIRLIHQKNILSIIISNSTGYRERLKKYLQKEINLQEGDTLLFVDLGYTGTTQITLAPIFREEFNVNIIGRYLICVRALDTVCDRKGMIDFREFADNALGMLVTYIALFEQLCTASIKSVIDFDEGGNPIHSTISVDDAQFVKLRIIQSECVRFVTDAEIFLKANLSVIAKTLLRDTAAVSLARLLFLPTRDEIYYLQSFHHDVNLSTKEVLPIFDLNKGLLQLRRRSWLFGIKDNIKDLRTNYPAEWRAANLELSLALMAQHRFDFSVAAVDLSFRVEKVPAIFSDGNNMFQNSFEALFTHDGFYSLIIPILNNYEIGVQFGALYQWMELECADMLELDALHSRHESKSMFPADEFMTAKDIVAKGGNLLECQSQNGMLIFVPPKIHFQKQMLLRMIFRPTVPRAP